MTLTCASYRATYSNGHIRLEIEPAPIDTSRRISAPELADLLGKTVDQVDKLSRRQSNPLPMTRTEGRPTIERPALNRWLLALVGADTAVSVFGI